MDAELVRTFREVFNTGAFSDLTLVCGEREFKVHKLILYAHSTYFRKLLGPKFKESSQDRIELHDDDADAVNIMIRLLYRHNANIAAPSTTSNTKPMCFAVQVWATGDKYDVPGLRSLAATRFRSDLDPKADLDDFLAAVRMVDAVTISADRTLWDIVITTTRKNMGFLREQAEFMALVVDVKRLISDLLGLLDTSAPAATVTDPQEVMGRGGGQRLGAW